MRAGQQVVVVLVAGGLGALLWGSQGAVGQGVPGWAPKVAGPVDAGHDPSVLHAEKPFRDPAGPAKADTLLHQTLEFALGFDPLERSEQEIAQRAAKARLDAGGPSEPPISALDAGVPPVLPPSQVPPAEPRFVDAGHRAPDAALALPDAGPRL